MDVKITNVYNNEVLPEKGLKGGHGQSFHITTDDKEVLFDVGWKGNKQTHNMETLGIRADKIDKVVLSHGHRDHTGGLQAFLEARTVAKPVQIVAHPNALEPKLAKKLFLRFSMGFPKLSKELMGKMDLHLFKDSVEVLPHLATTGEIPVAQRPEKPGIPKNTFHRVDGQWKWDPVVDDLFQILQTREGLIIITGCCHAGVLNTCARATQLFNQKIKAIIGGTHMLEYSKEDIEHVGDALQNIYGTPELYLNHCTGKRAIEQLRGRFGSQIVHDCHVGTEFMFEI
jgi:7,8-dihydropterin-6-yl-methyl-4-(beta-D-ribofuranosyl)aminobenzene 5'-phosphate synthase